MIRASLAALAAWPPRLLPRPSRRRIRALSNGSTTRPRSSASRARSTSRHDPVRRRRADRERRDRRFHQLAGHAQQARQPAVREAAGPTRGDQHDGGDQRHTYLFDLVANPGNRDAALRAAPSPIRRTSRWRKPRWRQPLRASGPTRSSWPRRTIRYAVVDPAALNFAWATSGDTALLPARIYDDGTATFLAWPAGQPVPAILVKDHEGTEGPVNFAVRGDTIVIDGVPERNHPALGRRCATLVNNGPVGAATADGSARQQGA